MTGEGDEYIRYLDCSDSFKDVRLRQTYPNVHFKSMQIILCQGSGFQNYYYSDLQLQFRRFLTGIR